MARIVTLEDIEGTRDEQDVPEDESSSDAQAPTSPTLPSAGYIATVNQVHEAYAAVNTLRYSQPTHLQGQFWDALDRIYSVP